MKMKIMAFVIVLLLLTGVGGPAEAGVIDILVTGIASPEGRLFVGLFRPEDDFPQQKQAYQGIVVVVDNREAATRFADVPDGTYAVAVYHDLNRNGELDRNLFGVPKEDYGFSNNARGAFGAPAFKEAAFEHGGATRIAIDLKP